MAPVIILVDYAGSVDYLWEFIEVNLVSIFMSRCKMEIIDRSYVIGSNITEENELVGLAVGLGCISDIRFKQMPGRTVWGRGERLIILILAWSDIHIGLIKVKYGYEPVSHYLQSIRSFERYGYRGINITFDIVLPGLFYTKILAVNDDNAEIGAYEKHAMTRCQTFDFSLSCKVGSAYATLVEYATVIMDEIHVAIIICHGKQFHVAVIVYFRYLYTIKASIRGIFYRFFSVRIKQKKIDPCKYVELSIVIDSKLPCISRRIGIIKFPFTHR